MTPLELLQKLKNEILLSIEYGFYEILSIKIEDDGWKFSELMLNDLKIQISTHKEDDMLILHNFTAVTRLLTESEKRTIINQLEAELITL